MEHRSVAYKIHYKQLVCDGDSKTHNLLLHGPDILVKKIKNNNNNKTCVCTSC